jgi:uncharacterized protein YgiM (DUF1202 family)
MKWWKTTMVLLFIGLAAGVAAAQGTMWVSSAGARIQEEPSASSETLGSLNIGDEVTVLAQEDRWYQVKAPNGAVGWMYRGRLSDTRPQKEAKDSDMGLFAGLGGSGMSVDEADTSRSVRGLSPETEAYARRKGTPEQYRRALEEVLAPKVTPQQLEQFLKQGQIGMYAESGGENK